MIFVGLFGQTVAPDKKLVEGVIGECSGLDGNLQRCVLFFNCVFGCVTQRNCFGYQQIMLLVTRTEKNTVLKKSINLSPFKKTAIPIRSKETFTYSYTISLMISAVLAVYLD